MKKIILLLILTIIIKLVYSSNNNNNDINIIPLVWPYPNGEFKYGTTRRKISPSLLFISSNGNSNTLNQAFQRYSKIIFKHKISSNDDNNEIFRVIINVDDIKEFYPQFDTDESYSLNINDSKDIIIESKNIYGALRGLESLSQLVTYDFEL